MSDEPRRFVVVGVGGVGGYLVSGLARMMEYRMPGSVLLMVDGDNYEPKNAERQEFTDLGNKAVVKANELQPQFPNTYLIPDDRWIVDQLEEGMTEENGKALAVRDLLAEGDVVYATVDNFAARKIIFDAAREYDNIDIFTGGNDEELYGSIYHYQRRDGKDVTDHPIDWHPEFDNPPDRNPGELSCQERAELEGGVQTLAANMTVAAFLLGRTHEVILEGKEDLASEIFFDTAVGLAQSYDRRVEEVTVPA